MTMDYLAFPYYCRTDLLAFQLWILFTLVFIYLCIIYCLSVKQNFWGHFCLYYDRTDQNWSEAKWERDRGRDRKGPRVGIRTRDARSATMLYVFALPTRLSTPTIYLFLSLNEEYNTQVSQHDWILRKIVKKKNLDAFCLNHRWHLQ